MQIVIWGIKDTDRVMWEVLGNGIDSPLEEAGHSTLDKARACAKALRQQISY